MSYHRITENLARIGDAFIDVSMIRGCMAKSDKFRQDTAHGPMTITHYVLVVFLEGGQAISIQQRSEKDAITARDMVIKDIFGVEFSEVEDEEKPSLIGINGEEHVA